MPNMMTYALKNGALTHISDVESGLKCGCVCPKCGNTLVAHKGKKLSHHFKHYNVEECEGSYQTSLHLLAKDILSKENRFVIPRVFYTFNQNVDFINNPSTEIEVDKVEIEAKTGDIVPDIVLHCGKQILLVEIYVTHKVDDEKLGKIKALGISTIEIDLSSVDRDISEADLRKILLNDSPEKSWVFNKYIEHWKSELYKFVEKYGVTERSVKAGVIVEHVNYCPLGVRKWHGKPFANYTLDCFECNYLVDSEQNIPYEMEFIYCIGKHKIKSLDDLKHILLKEQRRS